MTDIRDPNGRLADLARHVIAELDDLGADYLTARVPITSSEVLGRTQLIGTETHVAALRAAAERLASRLDGYTEMPDAKRARLKPAPQYVPDSGEPNPDEDLF